MTDPTPCSADAGVTTGPDGEAVALQCERPAEVVVLYAGLDRPMCRGHAATFCRSRPSAVTREISLESVAVSLGFESERELHRLVSSRDLSTPERLAAFKRWQTEDGSKAGLLRLPGRDA